jgi:hypothetical protein
LDLASGYWQVEMEEKDKSKTAFVSNMGTLQHTANISKINGRNPGGTQLGRVFSLLR